MTLWQRFFRKLVFWKLEGLRNGHLTIHHDGEHHAFGNPQGLAAEVRVVEPRFFTAVIIGGHVGAADAYAEGWWTTDDLPAVVRVFVQNRELVDGLETGLARLVQPFRWLIHALNRNNKVGSRRNIAAHYDLGNDFFELFLDESLTYSCAYFEHDNMSLAEASQAKYDRICRKLDLKPEHHLVEIGSGWGGFAIHAAQRYGCQVTTTTISQEQCELARERIRAAGLSDHVTVLLSDYRDIKGEYDRLVSIEMIEAVGHQYFPAYFKTCANLLSPEGLAAIQAITILDDQYEQARKEVDFIKRYIFPGSCIPSIAVLLSAAKQTDLSIVHTEDLGMHYVRTLREWRHRFSQRDTEIAALGFDTWFRRIWDFYFSYCEGGFAERAINVSQLIFAKPGAALPLKSIPQEEKQIA